MHMLESIKNSYALFEKLFTNTQMLEKNLQLLREALQQNCLIPPDLSAKLCHTLSTINTIQEELLCSYKGITKQPISYKTNLLNPYDRVISLHENAKQRQDYLAAYGFYQSFHCQNAAIEEQLQTMREKLSLLQLIEVPKAKLASMYDKYLLLQQLFQEQDSYKRFELILKLKDSFSPQLLHQLTHFPESFYVDADKEEVQEAAKTQEPAQITAAMPTANTTEAAEITTEPPAQVTDTATAQVCTAATESDKDKPLAIANAKDTKKVDITPYFNRIKETAALLVPATEIVPSSKAGAKISLSTIRSLDKAHKLNGSLIRVLANYSYCDLQLFANKIGSSSLAETLVGKLCAQGLFQAYATPGYKAMYSFSTNALELVNNPKFVNTYGGQPRQRAQIAFGQQQSSYDNGILLGYTESLSRYNCLQPISKDKYNHPINIIIPILCKDYFMNGLVRNTLAGNSNNEFIFIFTSINPLEQETLAVYQRRLAPFNDNDCKVPIILMVLVKEHALAIIEYLRTNSFLENATFYYTLVGDKTIYDPDGNSYDYDSLLQNRIKQLEDERQAKLEAKKAEKQAAKAAVVEQAPAASTSAEAEQAPAAPTSAEVKQATAVPISEEAEQASTVTANENTEQAAPSSDTSVPKASATNVEPTANSKVSSYHEEQLDLFGFQGSEPCAVAEVDEASAPAPINYTLVQPVPTAVTAIDEQSSAEQSAAMDTTSAVQPVDTDTTSADTAIQDTIPAESASQNTADFNPVDFPPPPTLEVDNPTLQPLWPMLASDKFYCAAAYLAYAAQQDPALQPTYEQLAHALNDPLLAPDYNPSHIYNKLSTSQPWEERCLAATVLRSLFFNQQCYPYQVNYLKNMLPHLQLLQKYPQLAAMLDQLMDFNKQLNCGPYKYALIFSVDNGLTKLQQQLDSLIKDTADLIKLYIGKGKHSRNNDRYCATRDHLFGEQGELAQMLYLIRDYHPADSKTTIELLKGSLCSLTEVQEYSSSIYNDENLYQLCDRAWSTIKNTTERMVRRFEISKVLQESLVKHLRTCLKHVADFITTAENLAASDYEPFKKSYDKTRTALLAAMEDLLPRLSHTGPASIDSNIQSTYQMAMNHVLTNCLKQMRSCLLGQSLPQDREFYLPLLKNFYIQLDEQYLPVLRPIKMLPHSHPLELIQQHFNTPEQEYSQVLETILKEKDYYGTAELLLQYLAQQENTSFNVEDFKKAYNYDLNLKLATDRVQIRYREFNDNLELRRSYGQLDDVNVEAYKLVVEELYNQVKESKNYQLLLDLMEKLSSELDELAIAKKSSILQEYQRISQLNEDQSQVQDCLQQVYSSIEENNYAAAEDMLNRIENGDLDFFPSEQPKDYLQDFLSNYDEYRIQVHKTDANLQSLLNLKRITYNKESKRSNALVQSWITTEQQLSTEKIGILLEHLGFKPAEIKEVDKVKRYRTFDITLTKAPPGRRNNYTHPVAPFGSIGENKPFRVICIFGNHTADNIQAIFEANNSIDTIILMDGALDLPQRRRLARSLRLHNNGHICAVIDRITINYLRRNYQEMSINKMLMELIMPFSYFQPYIAESAIAMPPEIFVGRTKELAKIQSATGVNLVYGGRQLGKSALLRQAWKNVHNNEHGHKAVLIDIKNKDVDQTAITLCQELKDSKIIPSMPETTDWNQISRYIREYISSGKTSYLLLLLDEADAFIEDCGKHNYVPIDVLKQLQNKTENGFKFVIAGLRDIIRFNQQATANNSSLPQLQYITIRPFKFAEAQQLLTYPLYYSGFRFPHNQECLRLMSTIFATTNYFPGLIQLYCRQLLDALCQSTYGNFNEIANPTYNLSEGLISHVLGQEVLSREIKEKFNITLELGGDSYYKIIALIVAYLYKHNTFSCTPQQVKETIEELSIRKMESLDLRSIKALMEELCELNILHCNTDSSYRFARQNFYQLMGSAQDIDEQLCAYMED